MGKLDDTAAYLANLKKNMGDSYNRAGGGGGGAGAALSDLVGGAQYAMGAPARATLVPAAEKLASGISSVGAGVADFGRGFYGVKKNDAQPETLAPGMVVAPPTPSIVIGKPFGGTRSAQPVSANNSAGSDINNPNNTISGTIGGAPTLEQPNPMQGQAQNAVSPPGEKYAAKKLSAPPHGMPTIMSAPSPGARQQVTMPVLSGSGGIFSAVMNLQNQQAAAGNAIAANKQASQLDKLGLEGHRIDSGNQIQAAGIGEQAARRLAQQPVNDASIAHLGAQTSNLGIAGQSAKLDMDRKTRMNTLQDQLISLPEDDPRRASLTRTINTLGGHPDKGGWQLHTAFGAADPITGQPTRSTVAYRTGQDGNIETKEVGGLGIGESAAGKLPNAGEVRGGFKFKGGNPNDKANWEKV